MSNFNTDKIDGVSLLNADEWNQIQDLENLITSSGQTPNTSLINQIPQAVANYVAIADCYTDSGTANNYILTSINTFKSPTAYVDGMRVRFITANANTGASTVNVANLGTKNIKKEDGTTDLTANDIPANNEITLIYRNGVFKIAGLSSVQNTSSTTKGIVYYSQPITISNNTIDSNNDIDFSAGNFIFSDFSGEATLTAMTKRLDANWTAGTNQGGLDTGTKTNSTWYHCYAIYNPTTGVSDAIFSTNATSPVLPSGYTKYNYRGSVLTDLSGNIRAFTQYGNFFEYKTAILSYSGPLTTTETFLQLPVPLGVICESRLSYNVSGTSQSNLGIFFRNPALTSRNNTHNSLSGVGSTPYDFGVQTNVITDQSSRIYISASYNFTPISISILGYKNFKL
jgi:hypothetical protein